VIVAQFQVRTIFSYIMERTICLCGHNDNAYYVDLCIIPLYKIISQSKKVGIINSQTQWITLEVMYLCTGHSTWTTFSGLLIQPAIAP
jgi:hypothetical protein